MSGKTRSQTDLEDFRSQDEVSDSLDGLDRLVELGCDKEYLLVSLTLLNTPFFSDDWEDQFGMTRKQLEGFIRRLRTYSRDIQTHQKGWQTFVDLYPDSKTRIFLEMPNLLDRYAEYLSLLQKQSGPKRHKMRNTGVCLLVQYVKNKTGRYYDREVSALISAVEDNPRYDTSRHSNWRRTNCGSLLKTSTSKAQRQSKRRK